MDYVVIILCAIIHTQVHTCSYDTELIKFVKILLANKARVISIGMKYTEVHDFYGKNRRS